MELIKYIQTSNNQPVWIDPTNVIAVCKTSEGKSTLLLVGGHKIDIDLDPHFLMAKMEKFITKQEA